MASNRRVGWRTLAPGQYEIVEVHTRRGITRALLFPKAILRAEWEADAPVRGAWDQARALASEARGEEKRLAKIAP
jgi:hypothetical protein